ncbi:MAG TPA: response regulator [Treponema sp.]|nr:response regulator [Treponema sp.]
MPNILIVEDDSSVSELIKEVLELENHSVQIAPSAEKSKELLRSGSFDLAIIDIILPGQGGMDLILELHEQFPSLGIILTSGKIDMTKSTFKVLAHQFGVRSILPKPFTVEELIASVTKALHGENNPV